MGIIDMMRKAYKEEALKDVCENVKKLDNLTDEIILHSNLTIKEIKVILANTQALEEAMTALLLKIATNATKKED